jgi:hypothetical protein
METNKSIKNVFSPEQIDYLRSILKNGETSLCKERGRNDIFIGSNIRQDIKDTIMKYFDNEYELYHLTYSEYSLDHGIPNLPPHTDPKKHQTSLTFDYQLEANIDWPVCVEDISHHINNNDAVIFDPESMNHFRPELEFKPGDYVHMFFFFLKKT